MKMFSDRTKWNLTPNRLSPASVNRDGRILLPVNTKDLFFYQTVIYDPARRTMSLVAGPAYTVSHNAGWAVNGNIYLQATRWTSTLWRYRKSMK